MHAVYSTTNGYVSVKLQTFDNDERSKEAAINWVDELLSAVVNFELYSELNVYQRDFKKECGIEIENKTDFPLIVINGIIEKYNLKIVEC